jgi:hypothetical protein|tara:strand:- start:434 stop:613 length:180 start_codon:yes stop_codon:yes gene_type:complete
MSEYCNYCKTDITISDNIEVVWKINLLNAQRKEEFKREKGLVCSVCLEVFYNNSEKIKA